MALHLMALISDSGLPIFSKKRGDCSVVSQRYNSNNFRPLLQDY